MNNAPRFGIIGSGSWSTALAKMLTDNGYTIYWWIRNQENLASFSKRKHNPHYLTSVTFEAEKIVLTGDLHEVIANATHLVVSIPSAYVLPVIKSTKPEEWQGKKVISAIKGILPQEHVLLNTWLAANHYISEEQYFAITGPCHAEEVAAERLSYLTFAGKDKVVATEIAQCFTSHYIQATATHDVQGAQLAAVLKNIYAVGAGMAHGLDYGDNFLSVYITCCYREMHRLLSNLYKLSPDAEPMPDYHTSAYLGDLLVTCYSLHSRNRSFGSMIGKGYSVQAATIEMKMVAEGYMASKGIKDFLEEHHLNAPIAEAIYNILWQAEEAQHVFIDLEKTFQ